MRPRNLRSGVWFGLDEALLRVACAGFRREKTAEFAQDVASHVRDGYLYVVEEEGIIRGFAVMKDFPALAATYISGIVKEPGILSGIIEEIVYQHVQNFGIVAVRTQNDRVVEIMSDICAVVFPTDVEPGQKELDILAAMGLLGLNVDQNLVAHGHYGGKPMIEGKRRRSKIKKITDITDRLDYEHGDAQLLVGYRK
jgi:hypothetical protein